MKYLTDNEETSPNNSSKHLKVSTKDKAKVSKTTTEKTEKATVKVKEKVKDSEDYQEPLYEDTGESSTEATGNFKIIECLGTRSLQV